MRIYKDEEVVRWNSDQVQSEISFQVRHLMISHVKGEFSQFEGTILTNGRDFSTADITLTIKSKSIDTGDSKRDTNLRGPDFLCTDQYKNITFRSTSISQSKVNGKMSLLGDLTIVGMTRNVRFDMQMGPPSIDSWGDETACVRITGKITRGDWNLHWTQAMEAAGFVMGDEIIISCKLELISLAQHDAKREQDPVLMRVMPS
jgi:polyisoprenoid-binding protein YceI